MQTKKTQKTKLYNLQLFSFIVKRNRRKKSNKVEIIAYYDGKEIAKFDGGNEFSYLNLAGHSGQVHAYAKRLAARALYYNGLGFDLNKSASWQIVSYNTKGKPIPPKGWKVILDIKK